MNLSDFFQSPEGILSFALRSLFIVGVFALVFGQAIWRHRKRKEKHRAAGTIGPSGLLPGARLPLQYAAIAQLGTRGPAPTTLNEHVLRAAIGVRLTVLAISGIFLVYLYAPGLPNGGFEDIVAELPVSPNVVRAVMIAAIVNGILYIFSHEARYDRTVLIVTRLWYFRRDFSWKNLVNISDDGQYELVLTFAPGGKAKVLKHSKGIEDFKAFALAKLKENF